MTNDDIAQKLALLPEGLAERNIQSWNKADDDFAVDSFFATYFSSIDELCKIQEIISNLSKSEQAKLFRAEKQWYYDLIISTADGQRFKTGEAFLRIYMGVRSIWARYEKISSIITDEKLVVHDRKLGDLKDDLMINLQPMLDLLWDETRGKKNA